MSAQNSPNPKPAGFSVSATAIRRHIGTLMLTLAIFVMGAFYITRLQVDLLPSIVYPRIGVQVNIPGISPEVAITEVTKPLEEALALTEGVNQLFSRTREGQVRVDLFFEAGSDVDQALNDAVASFNRGRSQLPDDIEDARIFKFDPSQFPIYEFALTSPALSLSELRLFADEELGRELAIVPGVAGIDVVGGVKEEVQVNLDLKRLQAVGVNINDVLNALRDRNVDISGGRLRDGSVEPLTRAIGKFRNAKELEGLSFNVSRSNASSNNGSITDTSTSEQPRKVYLRDFATIIDGTEEQRIFTTLNGQAAVRLLVTKQPDANTIEVVDRVKAKIATLQESGAIPSDAVLTATLDESRLIRASVDNVISSGIMGGILAGIAVLLFLGSIRQTLIITLAIPLATLASVVAMGVFGFSLNLFSLGGLALGVGGVVDCSVVMLDNIINGLERMRKSNGVQDTIAQTQASSSEIESALVASTSTNLVVIFPFLLLGGFLSLLFNQLILTISFGNIAAIAIAITVVPTLASRLLSVPWSSRLNETWLMRGFQERFAAATLSYARFLARIIHYRLLAVIILFAVLGGSGFLMGRQLPQEIIPQVKTGDVTLNAQFPAGTTLAANRKVMEIVDEILVKQPETAYSFTTVGGSSFGNNVTSNPLRSGSTITLKPNADLTGFISRVNREISKLNLAGIRMRVNPGQVRGIIVNNSPVPRTDIDIILQGTNPESLAQAGTEILSALEKNVKGANFRPDTDARQPEVQIFPDWERLQTLGLSTQSLGSTLQTAITGSVPTQLQRGDRLVDVRVQLDPESRQNASQLQQVPLFSANNRPIRLADVSTIREGRAPGEIQRINQRQVFLILGSLERGASLSGSLKQTEEAIAAIDLPEGVTVLPSTAKQANDNLSKAFGVLGLLASFLVFVVMAVQYNSLIDPLVIMLTIPLALAGGIVGLYVTNSSINVIVVIGVILLIGIVVNNAIVMVEFANQLREEQKCSRIQAILQAAPIRLRPILMTTITTVVGAFPLALGGGDGGEFLQPLGIVTFSGLVLGTLLTLFLIPCSYVLLHEFSWAKVSKLIPLKASIKN